MANDHGSLPSGTSLATLWLILIRMVSQQGVDSSAFVHDIGLTPAMLHNPGNRIPVRYSVEAFAIAAGRVADPAFGLQAARCWHPSNLGVVGYAWLSSETLRTGLMRLARFSRVLGPYVGFHCQQQADGLHVTVSGITGQTAGEYLKADFTLSVVVDMCRVNAGTRLCPQAVCLMRPAPVDVQPYNDFFGCPVRFGAAANGFVLATDVADAPLPGADGNLSALFDTILDEQLATLHGDNVPDQCRAFILKHLTSGVPGEEEVARSLHMSVRTLQRKLAEQQLNYQRLLDDTRHALALCYLADKARPIKEITFLLGFSEHSAFTRSFRRWHGLSPAQYRRRRAWPGG